MSLSKYAGMAGTWTIDLAGSAPNAESAFSLETTEESIFDLDYRSLADVNDYMDGGKYRAIVKLQMRYEKQSPDNLAYAMGQSGASVIRKNGAQIAIATHVYGSGDKDQASIIGKYGNDYDTLISVFTNQYPVVGSHEGISLVNPPSIASNGNPPMTPPLLKLPELSGLEQSSSTIVRSFSSTESTSSSLGKSSKGNLDEEGFLDDLKHVGSVVASIEKHAVPFVSPLFGPAGGAVSAIAGAALGAMANVCAESAMEGMSTEKAVQGTAERAILAEALFQAVKMSRSPVTDKILAHMQTTYISLAPNVKYIAPKLAPGLLSSAYKITVDKNFIQEEKEVRRLLSPRALKVNWAESLFGSNDFVDCMMQPTRPLEGKEAFFDQYTDDLATALRATKNLLREETKSSLHRLSKILAESSFDAESSLDNHDAQAAELVAKRAFMAEAALQAVMKLNKSELNELQLVNGQGGVHEEGFVDFVKTVGQKIGSVVKTNIVPLAKTIVPLVRDALAKPNIYSTSTTATKPPLVKLPPVVPKQTLRRHRSVLSLVNDGTLKVSTCPQDMPTLWRVDSNEDLPVFQEL